MHEKSVALRTGDGSPVAAPVRVLIAHTHAPTRAGIRLALERSGLSLCAEAADADGAVEAALRERPDVCLIEVGIPGSGIAATARIRAKLSTTAVVALGSTRRHGDVFDALRAGAAGFLPRDMDPARLADVVLGVAHGEAALPRRLVARLIEEYRNDQHRRVPLAGELGVDLTTREWEVLDLLRVGLSTAQIAKRLFISHVTVRRHIGTVVRKLGVQTRADAIRLIEERSEI
jgi:DNA-binding NarL/FixJ family response regulator